MGSNSKMYTCTCCVSACIQNGYGRNPRSNLIKPIFLCNLHAWCFTLYCIGNLSRVWPFNHISYLSFADYKYSTPKLKYYFHNMYMSSDVFRKFFNWKFFRHIFVWSLHSLKSDSSSFKVPMLLVSQKLW